MKTQSLSSSALEHIADLRDTLGRMREQLGDVYEGARDKVVAGAKVADKTIRKRPYESMAAALGVGVLVGMFVLGRRNED